MSTTGRCTAGRWSTRSPRPGASTSISTPTTIRCGRSGGHLGERRIRRRSPSQPRGASRIRRSASSSRPWTATGIGPGRVHVHRRPRLRTARRPRRHRVPEEQVISVVRKGSRALQRLPASTDAFVWLRLYQQETRDLVPKGPKEALWWTLRRPFRPLTYDATRMVFNKANTALGANWTLHDLRHSAAKRMVRDPGLTLADVQWVLGHAHITTTEIYTAPTPDEVIAHVLAHHERQRRSGPSLPHRRRPATDPRCWRRCSAPRPPTEDPMTVAAPGRTIAKTGPPKRTASRMGAAGIRAELVAEPPKPGTADRAAAWLVHRPERGPHPRQDPQAQHNQAPGLAPAPAWDTGQERWLAGGADSAGFDRADLPLSPRVPARRHHRDELRCGLALLVAGQVIRPGYPWLLRQRQALMPRVPHGHRPRGFRRCSPRRSRG